MKLLNRIANLADKIGGLTGRAGFFRDAIILFLLIILGAILRFHHIGLRPFWLDEANSVNMVYSGWGELYQEIILTGNSFAYIYILKAWALFFGDSETALRSLSVIAGLASIPVIYFLARRLFDNSAALWAAFLLSVNYYAVFYSIQARPYSLIILISIISCYYYVKLLEPSRPASGLDVSLYIIFTALNLYLHPWCFLLLAAQGIYLFFSRPLKVRIFIFQSIILVLAIPWLKILYFLTSRHYSSFIESPSFPPAETLNIFMYGSQYIFLAFSLVAAGQYFFQKISEKDEDRIAFKEKPFSNFNPNNFFALALLAVPLVLAYLVDLFVPFYQAGRYEAPALAGFILVIASAWSSYKNKIAALALCLVLFFFSLAAVKEEGLALKELDSNDRSVALELIEKINSGDIVIFTGLSRPSLDYYLDKFRGEKKFSRASFPAELEIHPAFVNEADLTADISGLEAELSGLAGNIEASGAKNIWVVYSGGKTGILLADRLSKEFSAGEEITASGENPEAGFYSSNLHFFSILSFKIE